MAKSNNIIYTDTDATYILIKKGTTIETGRDTLLQARVIGNDYIVFNEFKYNTSTGEYDRLINTGVIMSIRQVENKIHELYNQNYKVVVEKD